MIIRVVASASLAVCIAAPACFAATVTPREARAGKVTACSKYGSQCYTAKLVRTPVGWKMRLKGGTLIHCEVTCDDTLRRATVDFWEDQRERAR
jgi:hypothetical protein